MGDDDLLPVRDIDICLDPGLAPYFVTIWPEDTLTIDQGGDITISLRQRLPDRRRDEDIVIRGEHVRWFVIMHDHRKLPKPIALTEAGRDLQSMAL
jgi:hypothetical protein